MAQVSTSVGAGARGGKVFTQQAPTATPAQILASDGRRINVSIYNNGTQTVYLGADSTVSSSTGLPLPAGAVLDDQSSYGAWWAVVASGTGDLRICEVS